MSHLFDYLDWRGDLPLTADPFNVVDGVILARLAYMPFELLDASGVPAQADNPDTPAPDPKPEPTSVPEPQDLCAVEGQTLSEAAARLMQVPDLEARMLWKYDLRLLRQTAESPRFADMRLHAFQHQLDPVSEIQFAAVTFTLPDGRRFLSFRGTDNTLVGWKEDFNMGFMVPVPSQRSAARYLSRVAGALDGPILLGGHSKGGNLAVYAAACAEPAHRDRIGAIYNFDGPGFNADFLSTDGYRQISGRIETFVPQSSVVGLLLENEERYTIIHSAETGPMQHDVYSWSVVRNRFRCLNQITRSSQILDRTLKDWVAKLTPEQRADMIDAIYDIMTATDAVTLKDLSDHWFRHSRTIFKSIRDMDDDTRENLSDAFGQLIKSALNSWMQLRQPDETEQRPGALPPAAES